MTPSQCSKPRLVRGFEVPGCGGTCASCRAYARARWVSRVLMETSGRKTWVCSLTYAGTVEPDYSEVQKAVKRMRKAGLDPRYFAVIERGSLRGRWHCHMIVTCQCTRRALERHWHIGFSKATLLKSGKGAARYVAKYLQKGDGRAKASIRYGWGRALSVVPDAVAAVFAHFPDAEVISYNRIKMFKAERTKVREKLTSIRPLATFPSVWTDAEMAHERDVFRRLCGIAAPKGPRAVQLALPIGGAQVSLRPHAEGGPYVID